MKIGIIGLQPRQFADLDGREFSGHTLHRYDSKSFAREQVAAFTRKMDKVLIVMPGAPKTIIEMVPYAVRHVMHGSASTVVRYLSTLPKAEAAVEPQVKQPVVEMQEEEAEAQPTVIPPPKIASIVPSGYESQYRWPPDAVLIDGDALPMRKRFEMLDAAQPGDVVRYARPTDTTLPTWRNRVGMLRHNRMKKNQLIEAHFYPEYVDLLVMSQGTTQSAAAAVGTDDMLKTTRAGLDIHDGGAAMANAIPMVDIPIPADLAEPAMPEQPATVDESIVAPPVATQPLPATPMQQALDSKAPDDKLTPHERGFWRQAYLSRTSGTAAEAARYADESVIEWRKRFK